MATRNVEYMQPNRSVAEVLNEFKSELKDFLNTRLQMLRAEMSEKTAHYKAAAPALVIGALFLAVTFLLLTGTLVTLLAWAFAGRPYAYILAFAITTVLYGLIGGIALLVGWKNIKEAGITPERTLRVLKEDQVWLQTEARTQL